MTHPTIDLAAIASNLELNPEGIWVARSRSEISYPEEGNLNCLALEADSFWFGHRNRCIQTLMRRFPPSGTVFDVGGGNGYVALGLKQAGIPVALLEPGWAGIRSAQQRGVDTLICSSLEDARFQPGSLPAVGAFDVLEHIEQDQCFLSKVHELLVPGGWVYLTVPAYQQLWSADDNYSGHFRRYALSHLRDLLSQVGFRVNFASYIFFMLPLPIFLFRSVPTRLGWRKQEAWDRYQKEHRNQSGLAGQLLERLLDWELSRLRAGHTIPVGGSCLIAAQKV